MTRTTTKSMEVRPRGKDLRGQNKPLDSEEELEIGLEDSMDASDPPSATAPGHDGYPGPLPDNRNVKKHKKQE